MYIFLKAVQMKSLREIAGESKGNYSNLGDIKHKFEFHSDCVGLHFPELSDRSNIYDWVLLSCDKTMERLTHSLKPWWLSLGPMCKALYSFSISDIQFYLKSNHNKELQLSRCLLQFEAAQPGF